MSFTTALIPTLAMAPWATGVLGVLYVVVCLMLILTVLIQRPQGGGLAGAFGSGAGSGQTAFGTKTGDALTIFTIVVFIMFVGMSIGLNFALRPATAAEVGTTAQDPGTVPTPTAPDQAAPGAGMGSPADAAPTIPPAITPPVDAAPAGTTPAENPSATPATTPATANPAPAPAPTDKPAAPPAGAAPAAEPAQTPK